MRFIPRALLGGLLALAAAVPAFTPVAAAPATFTVQAGAATKDASVVGMLFQPASITVDAGDSVTWNVSVAHIVAFGAPPPGPPDLAPAGGKSYDGSAFTSSGLTFQGQTYTLTFSKAGTYSYQCLIHPASMKGTVVVQPEGTAYPVAPGSYNGADSPAFAAALQSGQAALAANPTSHATNAGGATTWKLYAGLGTGKDYSVERFTGDALTINTGDTVTWTQPDPNEEHTVTFLSGAPDPKDTLPNGQPNLQVFGPVGGHTYDGSGYLNSGYMPPGSSYSLTFSKAGTYKYQCLIHDTIGMVATINVANKASTAPSAPSTPAQAPPAPASPVAQTPTIPEAMPSTGAGGAPLSGGIALLGLLLAALGSIRLLARRT